jgi:hypothetical protein
MKNINVEYDMDENDLDIILREITKENKKKPTLAYIFENYTNLLSVFKPHVIKKVLDTIEEGYEYAPNEGEETGTILASSPKSALDKAKQAIKNLEKTNLTAAKKIDAQPDLVHVVIQTRQLFPHFRADSEVLQFIKKSIGPENFRLAYHAEKENNQFEDEPHDIESDPESMREESSFGNAYDRIMGQLNEAHVPEGDDEGRMLEYQLRTIRDEIDELLPMIKPNDQFEGWVQSKVTLAKDYVSAVRDYLTQHYAEYHSEDDGDRGSHDLSDDAEALASAGHGTDEDYGYYGGNEDNEEVKEGVVEEKKGSRCTKVTGQMQSTRSDKKYMRCARVDGKLKRVHYGDPKRRIKKSNPKKRKSFRARHKCSTAKPGTAKYYSCKNWIIPFVSVLLPLLSGIHTLV